jgi:hypothetical protein
MGERKDTHQTSSTLYTAAGFFLLRAPVLPAHVFSQIASTGARAGRNEGEPETTPQRSYELLQTMAAQPEIELALAASSFALLEGITHIQQGERSRRVERAYSRLLRYIIRMSTRPTPFGMFAGITVGTFAKNTAMCLSTPIIQKIRSRPDMNWLLSVIKKIEQTQELVPHLYMVVNQTIYFTGGRAILPCADIYGQQDQRSISLRATPVVHYILDLARQPIPFHDLHAALLERFPQARPEQADRLLLQLWENHYLTSNLRPSLTTANPASYTLSHLIHVPAAGAISEQLSQVLQKTEEIDRAGTGGSSVLLRDLKRLQEQLVPDCQTLPFQIDTALQLKTRQLTQTIGAAAAQTAETLLRLSRLSQGLLHLQEYRAAFLERYGMEAEVPLLELLNPETGLDAPSTYTQPPRTYQFPYPLQPPDMRRRDTILGGLIAQAINERSLEVELTAALLRQLEQWTLQAGTLPPPSLEIYLQLHAASQEALDRGEWRAVVSPNCGSPGGGRTFCRFFDLLGVEDLEALQRFIKQEEALSPDVVFAELSYLPTTARAANVAVRPVLRDYEIVMNLPISISRKSHSPQ